MWTTPSSFGRDTLDSFLDYPDLKFTVEVEKNGVIPFFSVLVTWKPKIIIGIEVGIYIRSSKTHIYPSHADKPQDSENSEGTAYLPFTVLPNASAESSGTKTSR
ncbi:hypothetical protein Trydic_g19872 [Trypoxylus dichotomus]